MTDKLKELIHSKGFDHFGWTSLKNPLSLNYYKTWIEAGYHGEMNYLERHFPFKENPELLLPTAKSAIVIAQNYLDLPGSNNFPLEDLKVARYAIGRDYHVWLKDNLDELCHAFKEIFPEHEFLAFTDSKPVLERDLAYRAGLGWVGKNTCIIHEKKGSFFFLGEIFTSLVLEAGASHPDRCGTCTRCLDACPTQAIIEPRKLDATKCISYWTIEAKSTPPPELVEKFDGWYFGCDICQTVCPWNQKVLGNFEPRPPSRNNLIQETRWILKATDQEIENKFQGTPLERTKPWGHKRNALIVTLNSNLTELKEEVKALKEYSKFHKQLQELVNFALSRLES